MIGTLDTYNGISSINYSDPGKFHTVKRPDALLNIAVAKSDEEAETLVDVQFCLDDVNNETHWVYNEFNQDAVTNADGNGSMLSFSVSGITGVRIIPKDGDTNFSLLVREFFPPAKIKCYGVDNYGIG